MRMLGRFEGEILMGGSKGRKKTCRRQFLAGSWVAGADRLADVDC